MGNWYSIHNKDGPLLLYDISRITTNKFCLRSNFNSKVTIWKKSHNGLNNKSITFPVKFPLLLYHGVDAIAVGFSTKILCIILLYYLMLL